MSIILVILIGLLPYACGLDDTNTQSNITSSQGRTCFIEHGFDYVGNDLYAGRGHWDVCCRMCDQIVGCRAWSWTEFNHGTCWLKYAIGDIVVNPAAKSSVLLHSSNPTCQVTNDIDYVGNDLARVDANDVDRCCYLCHNYPGCRAYSWSDYHGGSCWLKSKVTQIITKPGVKSAEAYPSLTYGCQSHDYHVDYVGYDIASKPSASYGSCCEICRNYPGCNAFTWSEHNGGTCWLKSQKGAEQRTPGVISAVLEPSSPCTIQKDTDYYDHDLTNVPGKDANECCVLCHNCEGCKAFTWSNFNGGRCWLKTQKGSAITKSGVQAGTL